MTVTIVHYFLWDSTAAVAVDADADVDVCGNNKWSVSSAWYILCSHCLHRCRICQVCPVGVESRRRRDRSGGCGNRCATPRWGGSVEGQSAQSYGIKSHGTNGTCCEWWNVDCTQQYFHETNREMNATTFICYIMSRCQLWCPLRRVATPSVECRGHIHYKSHHTSSSSSSSSSSAAAVEVKSCKDCVLLVQTLGGHNCLWFKVYKHLLNVEVYSSCLRCGEGPQQQQHFISQRNMHVVDNNVCIWWQAAR